jgi:hypothetical protein
VNQNPIGYNATGASRLMTRPTALVASMMNFVISSVPAAVTNRSSPPRSVAPALQRPLGSRARSSNPLERFPGPADTVENRGAKADSTPYSAPWGSCGDARHWPCRAWISRSRKLAAFLRVVARSVTGQNTTSGYSCTTPLYAKPHKLAERTLWNLGEHLVEYGLAL